MPTATWRTVAHALTHHYNGDPFQRVVYTESHDEVANGKARIPHEIAPDDPAHLDRAEALDAGRGADVDRAGHPDAVPGPGVPAGRLVPGHRAARLGPEPRIPRHRPALPRPDPAAARPRRRHRRAVGARHGRPPHRRVGQADRLSVAGTKAGRATTWSWSRTSAARPARRLPHRLPGAGHVAAAAQHRLDRLQRGLRRLRQPRRRGGGGRRRPALLGRGRHRRLTAR